MAGMTDYLENKLVDHIFRGTAFSAPTTLYVGLLTAAPSDTGGGTEVSGGSYARVTATANSSNFKSTNGTTTGVSSGTSGTTTNGATFTFPAPTANWGVITHTAIYDAATSGNMLFFAPLTLSKTVNNGDSAPSFAVDALSIQIDN